MNEPSLDDQLLIQRRHLNTLDVAIESTLNPDMFIKLSAERLAVYARLDAIKKQLEAQNV